MQENGVGINELETQLLQKPEEKSSGFFVYMVKLTNAVYFLRQRSGVVSEWYRDRYSEGIV